ncbi:Ras-specific guanine nucleotide-releasing factor 2, partial [Xenotaenia resolanae]
MNDRSPRLCRKFSSPPPLSIQSRTSSPVRTRKLSLHSPITARVGGLDLTSLSNSNFNHNSSQSAASSPTSAQTPTPTATSPPSSSKSPPPDNCKPSQDQAPLTSSSPDQSPSPAADREEVPRIDPFCGKLRRSIRR